MRWRGIVIVLAVGPGLFLIAGIGFLVAAAVSASGADAYRAAQPCLQPGADPANCYGLRSGVIRSVHVSQTRRGEEDDVVLDTQTGPLSVTLRPSSADAPHVRSGASAAAKLYRGDVTAVVVDGLTVPSLANPSANQSQYGLYGIWFTGLALVFAGLMVVRLYRGRARLAGAGGPASPTPPLQVTTVPGGDVGVMLGPRMSASMWWRQGFVAVLVILLPVSVGWLRTPALAPWVMAGDGVLLSVGALGLWLYLHNTRLFVDRQGLRRVDWLGRLTRCPSGSLVRAVRYSVSSRYGRNPYLSFVGSDGREVFKVPGRLWDATQLEVLCQRARLPVDGSYGDAVTAFAMNRRVPGSAKWGRSIVLLAVILAAIVGLTILLTGPTSR